MLTEVMKHSNGSSDDYAYELTGKPYTSTHTVYDTSGHITSIDEYTASNTLYAHFVSNSDGTTLDTVYNSTGGVSETVATETNGDVDTTLYNSTGAETSEAIKHADGSSDNYSYGLTGTAYSYYDNVENAAGQTTMIAEYNGDGSLYVTRSIAANGSSVTNDYVKGAVVNAYANDTFVFHGGNGQTTINNFIAGDATNHDTIQIDHTIVASYSQLNIQASGADTLVSFGQDTIVLKGIDPTHLTQSDFLFA
jgi:hypothetical protein